MHVLELLAPLVRKVVLRVCVRLFTSHTKTWPACCMRTVVVCCCEHAAVATDWRTVACSTRKWRRLIAGRWMACSRKGQGTACLDDSSISTIIVVGMLWPTRPSRLVEHQCEQPAAQRAKHE